MKLDFENLAREAGMNIEQWHTVAEPVVWTDFDGGVSVSALERFAALVRNEVLEQAAQASENEHLGEVDEDWHHGYNTAIRDVSEAIRHMKQEAE